MKEQSSILTPNNKLVGVESTKEEPKLPKPTGWRHLVETTLERQQVASQVGLVLAMGPQCYKDKERYPEGPWCKEKDWIMFVTLRTHSLHTLTVVL